jgi:PHP domain
VATENPHDLAAVVHVRSTYSDGTASVPEIIEAAADAEADAVLLTDHDTLQAREDGYEGWHHGVLVLVGIESDHLLAFDDLRFPAIESSESAADGEATGIELWSVVAGAAEFCRTPRQLVSFISRPEEAVDQPARRNVEEWDRLCMRRRTVAIGGVGAQQNGNRIRGGTVLSPLRNARFFRMLRTHVLCERVPSGDLDSDRRLILGALREGRCYLGRDSLAASRGFRYYAEGPNGFLPMGGEAPAASWNLHVRLPLRARIRLIRNGRQIRAATGSSLGVVVKEPGVYRVEAQLQALGKLRTWILSNPIYLR